MMWFRMFVAKRSGGGQVASRRNGRLDWTGCRPGEPMEGNLLTGYYPRERR